MNVKKDIMTKVTKVVQNVLVNVKNVIIKENVQFVNYLTWIYNKIVKKVLYKKEEFHLFQF